MCGRYAAAKDTATLVEEFQVDAVVEPAPEASYNVAPTHQVAVVLARPTGDAVQRQLRTARWGLVPSWAKDPSIGSRMINARLEAVATKPAFRAAFARRRCIVPADGYFEWYRPTGPRPRKQPYFIHRADGTDLAMAGLLEFWRPDPQAPWLLTVAVLTIPSAGVVAPIHDRMPLVMPESAYAEWLDPTREVPADFSARLPMDLLVAHPVGTAVNSVRNNSPDLLLPIPAVEEPA